MIRRIRNWWHGDAEAHEYLRQRQLEREWRNSNVVISDNVGYGEIKKP